MVGFAGLLDLGYIAFYAVGAYVYALLACPQFGLHLPFWVILPIGAAVAALFGVLLGAPTLKLRGDYLAIVTLGFGEIIRIFLNNLSRPVNITNGPQGITRHRPVPHRRRSSFAQDRDASSAWMFSGPIKYYYLLLAADCSPSSSSTCGCRTRASAAPGWRSARTRSRRARWASTPQRQAAGVRDGRDLRRRRRRHVLGDPGLHQPGELRAGRVDHGAVHGGAGRHGQHLGRDPRRGAAVVRARDPALDRRRRCSEALFGRMLIEPEVIRMLLFGLALVLMMLFRPAGLLPSAVRKRELAASGEAPLVDARL